MACEKVKLKVKETNILKANIYYDMNMHTDSKQNLQNLTSADAKELKYKIKKM